MTFSEQARAARAAAISDAAAERARERLTAYDRGLRGDELAAACGVAPGSVRQVLTRARRLLGVPSPGARDPEADSVRGQEPEEHGY